MAARVPRCTVVKNRRARSRSSESLSGSAAPAVARAFVTARSATAPGTGDRSVLISPTPACCVVPARTERTGTLTGPLLPRKKVAGSVVSNCVPSAVTSFVCTGMAKVDAAPVDEVNCTVPSAAAAGFRTRP